MITNSNKEKYLKSFFNSEGFTLIELLAVIVILAIIALIATPIIMNVINDSKKGAAKDSMYAYVKSVELAAMKKVTPTDNGINGTFDIKNGDLYDQTSKNLVLEVEVKGSKPTSGTVTIVNGQVTGVIGKIDGQDVTYDKDGATPTAAPTTEPERKYVDSWTEELNASYPTSDLTTGGEFETYENIKKVYPDFRCDKPLEIKAYSLRFPDKPLNENGQTVHVDLETGFYCKNSEQTGFMPVCYDYAVKILCRNYID